MLGHFLCYAPQGDGDPRYTFSSQMEPLPAALRERFIREARETLTQVDGGSPALWQYVCLGTQGPALLLRAAPRIYGGAPMPVVWGLVLPLELLHSRSFALSACLERFAALDEGAGWPEPVELEELVPEAPLEEGWRLAAAYRDAGRLRVPQSEQTPRLLCQLVERLAPADRLHVSFATASLGQRRVEADPGLGPEGWPPASPATLALLHLWDRLGPLLDAQSYLTVSLMEEPQTWLPPLQGPDRAERIAQIYTRATEGLAPELLDPVAKWLRPMLEECLLLGIKDPQEAAGVLDELCRSGLLTQHALFPPLWPARMAAKRMVLGKLDRATLAHILIPGVTSMLLDEIRQGEAAAKTADLVAGISHAPASVTRPLAEEACERALACLSASPQPGDADLGMAITALALYFNRGPRGSRDATVP